MQKVKMSVTRALAEVKRIEEQIQSAVYAGKYVAATVGVKRKVVGSNDTESEVKAKIQRSFDKISALQKNRQTLKSAIIKSNSETLVKLGEQELTVAEVIELKSTVALKENFLYTLRQQLTQVRNGIDSENARLEQQIQTHLQNLFSGESSSKIDQVQVDGLTKTLRDDKEQKLFDPAGIEGRIEKLEKEISDLKTEADFVLSESNAKTQIEVEFVS